MTKKEEKLIEHAKKVSLQEVSAYSLMDGFGLRYITPFANAIGVSNTYIGLLTSFPSLLGNLSQLVSTKAMEFYSRKKIVFWSVLFQSLMWLVLVFLGAFYFIYDLSKVNASNLLVIIYTLLTIFGAFAGPSWSSWMKDIVTTGRGSYFGKRSRLAGLLALIFFFIGGFILDYFKQTNIFIAFTILFSIAFFGRFISAALFLKQYEPKLRLKKGYYFSFFEFIKKMPFNNFGRFAIFTALLNFSVALASPFFAIYLLEDLGLKFISFGYILYTIVIMATPIISILFLSRWGRFADKFGNYKVIKLTAFFIPLIPVYWIISYFLIGRISLFLIIIFFLFFEGLAGWVWSGFNLASGNYIYDAVTRERMAICVAYHNFLNGLGIFLGASIGGVIASLNMGIFGSSSLLIVFALSALVRFVVVKLMVNKIKEVREIPSLEIKQELREDRENNLSTTKSLKKFHIAHLTNSVRDLVFKPRLVE